MSKLFATSINMLGNQITGLALGTASTDAVNKSQLDLKVTANTLITPKTATKITFDEKGLVLLGENILATDLPSHNHAISDVTGLQSALDGKSSASHNHVISDVTGLQSALDRGQFRLATCTTAQATVAKVVDLSGYTLNQGDIIQILFTYAAVASATINVNGVGAKTLYYGGAVTSSSSWSAGQIVSCLYDGSAWHVLYKKTPGTTIGEFVFALNPSYLTAATPVNKGGTNKTSWTAFSLPYASASTTIAEVAPNKTTTAKFLAMTGTGSAGTAPSWVAIDKASVGLINVDNTSDLDKPISTNTQTALNLKVDSTHLTDSDPHTQYILKTSIGVDVAPVVSGKIPSTYLPSYVDDIREYNDLASFPATGEIDVIYVAKDTNRIYRWSGSAYVELSVGVVLGETATTAFDGLRGKMAYTHSLTTGNPHNTAIADISGLQTSLDSKASSTHVHGNITNAGAIGSTSGLPVITTTGGVLTTSSFGTTAGTFCQGNDSRLSDSRTPTSHASTSTTFGVGSSTNYGHVKLYDSLSNSVVDGAPTVNAVYDGLALKMNTSDYPDIVAIEALSGTTGLLRKSAANTWVLDTNTFATTDQLTNGSVTRIGTTTVGGPTQHVYLNLGTPVASVNTIGSASVPIYLNSGVMTACTSISLNAATATKLATARTIALTGDVTGSASFDGSENISITSTVVDDSHNHSFSTITGLQTAIDSKVESATIGGVAVTKTGTNLDFPAYPSAATQSSDGLLSASDKIKLDSIGANITLTNTLTLTTTWTNTGFSGTDIPTGSYFITVLPTDGAVTGQVNVYYTGIMSWFSGGSSHTESDEIILHRCGGNTNNSHIYLRVLGTATTNVLQIAFSSDLSSSTSINIMLRKII